MFAPETENLVEQLIQAEYKNACEKFGEKYHSLHEGYAVLLEEVEEAVEAIKSLVAFKKQIWYYLKKGIHNNGICFEQSVCFAENDVEQAIKELAQVGAVLQKIRNTIDEVKEE
jgi:NTP pyrophosphatase (non-canonical NTP hydrolase)